MKRRAGVTQSARRGSLKICWAKAHEGSSPSSGTDPLERQLHSHGRPFAVAIAFEPERTGVRFGHDPRDIKTDAHPGEGCGSPRPADEGMAELPYVVGRDPDAFVSDRDLGATVIGGEHHADPPAGR